MSNGILAVFGMLVLTTILVAVNDQLNGSKTQALGMYLRFFFIFGCLVAPLVFGQWQAALAIVFIWMLVVRPISRHLGASIAIWVFRRGEPGPFESWVGLPSTQLARITRQLAATDGTNPTDVTAFLERGKQREMLRTAALDLALGQPRIQVVLRHFGASREAIESAFNELIATGIGQIVMGHYLPYAIAYYPRPLAVLLSWKAGQLEMSQIEMACLMLDYFRFGRRLPTV